jgi:outer membrane protein assembly factor BamB
MSPADWLFAVLLLAPPAEGPGWPQWGGPNRDFVAPAATLAESWPENGPPEIWSRPLGDGHSAILFDAGRLYTMYRPQDVSRKAEPGSTTIEAVVCLDASTGDTVWEYRYDARAVTLLQYGDGPRSTPLIVGNRLFSVGRSGRMLALDRHDGSLLWSRELWDAGLGGNRQSHGYASSPLAWGDSVIVPVGAADAAVVAFDQATGELRWKAPGFRNSLSSPRILEIAGRQQLLMFMREEIIGLDPQRGRLLWSWPHANQWGHNITMPSAVGDTLFVSSPQAGARGLRLLADGDRVDVEQIWSSRRVQFYHATTVQDGDWVYGSSGTNAPAFMTAVNIRTGEVAWRRRGFAKANVIAADGHLLILDENGVLYLAEASSEELVVLDSAQLLDRYAWTVPTLVGTTLYARDRYRIVAVDLG